MAVHDTMAHIIMESTILPGSQSLCVGRERLRMPNKLLVLDGAVYQVNEDFEWSEVGFIPVDLGEVSSWLVDNSDHPAQSLLQRNRLRFLFFHSPPHLGEQLAELWVASSI